MGKRTDEKAAQLRPYHVAKAKGLCTYCHKVSPSKGLMCDTCKELINKRKRDKYRQANGIPLDVPKYDRSWQDDLAAAQLLK